MGAFWKFRFWDYRWYQQAANDVNSWEFSKETQARLDMLLTLMPKETQTKLLALTKYLYDVCMRKYGAMFVKHVIIKVVQFLQTLLSEIKEEE